MKAKNRILCLLLCFIMMLTSLILTPDVLTASAKTKTELEDDIREYDKQIDAAEDKLNELKEKKEKQQEYLEALEEQINVMKAKATAIQTQVSTIDAEIEELNKKLKQLGSEIALIEEDIEKTEKNIQETEDNIAESSSLLAKRIRAAYMKGDDSDLQILLGADSLASFLTRLEMMKRTSEADKKLIDEFKAKVIQLEKDKKKLEEDKAALSDKKTELDIKKEEAVEKKKDLKAKQAEHDKARAELQASYDKIESYVAELDRSSAAYKGYIAKMEKNKKEADAEIDRILSEYYATSNQQSTTLAGSNANPNGGGSSGGKADYVTNDSWAWPIGNRWCYISSKYGYRDASISGWSFHGGIDLAGGNGALHGAPVYATRSGRVITAVTSYDPRGYGIYVVIDHGDGYSSLYGHMSARYVNTGDTVTKGQMIGRVGDTGNTKGAHLHFEIRYYGEKKDPLNYVKNPN
ncbi:MAG: peptidoglycan DD-metalloendopeptidase family protein [Clostridia bacterium]|nr:peptidoglycan DD-metalloendopeptidase family protein [Clostridia bacterium]